MFEIERLGEPVTATDPCGPDLGYEGAFLELERLAAGVPEQRMGWSWRAAVAPDWMAVATRATALLARSKDWRIALLFARAALHLEGWRGLESGLGLLLALEERFGASVHPRGDPDNPEGWWADNESIGRYVAERMPGSEHPLLADLHAWRIGTPPEEMSLREVEWVQEERSSVQRRRYPGGKRDISSAELLRAVCAELLRHPDLASSLDASLAILRELERAVQQRLALQQPHSALREMHDCLSHLADALRWTAAIQGAEVAGAAPVPTFQDLAAVEEAASRELVITTRPRAAPRRPTPELDVDALSAPIDADLPCGPDLEYDAAFLELTRLQTTVPDRVFGSFVFPAQPPDWEGAHGRAIQLLERTKDLRVAVTLARAATWSNGLHGAASGLALIARLLSAYWRGVYPMLDAEDNNDPTMRLNVLAALSANEGLLGDLRTLEIGDAFEVVLAGQIERALDDADAAAPEPGAQGKEVLTKAVAAQLEREPAFGRWLHDARAMLREIGNAITSCTDTLGVYEMIDPIGPLAMFLERLDRAVQGAQRDKWPERRSPSAAADAVEASPSSLSDAQPDAQPPPSRLPTLDDADLERARMLLDRIRAWFDAAATPAPRP